MATYNGKSYSDTKNINLRGGAMGTGLIRFSQYPYTASGVNWGSNPFSSTEVGMYINTSGDLVYSYLGTATTLGAAGSTAGVTPTWEKIFSFDTTFQVAGTTWTIDDSTAGSNNILTITDSGAGSGNLIQITNTGTGKDINGTSNTWSVTKAGAAVFASATLATLTGTTNLTLAAAGAGAVILGTGSNTVTIARAATFSSTVTVTDGVVTLANTANSTGILYTSSATTAGVNSASTGAVVFRSTSITTGTLLKLQLAEGTVSTGWYLNCFDSVGAASVFSVGAAGATVIAGSAYATAALTVTAGDIVVSAGKINQTAVGATTANGFTGVYNGLTTGRGMDLSHTTSIIANGGSVLKISSTGIDTATTSGCLLNLVSSASTDGTQVLATFSAVTVGTGISLVMAGLTTGIGFSSIFVGLTTGQGFKMAHTTSTIADGGSMMALSTTAANTGGATNGTVLDLKATAQLAGTLVRLDSIQTTGTAMSIISTGIMTTTGNLLTLTANSATTAAGLLRINANGLTDGIGLIIASSATASTATGRLFKVVHSGVTSTSGILAEVLSAANDETVLMQIKATDVLALGKALNISLAAMTTGTGISMVDLAGLTTGVGLSIAHATSAIADTGSLVRLASSGVNTGGATNGTMLDVIASGQLAGVAVKIVTGQTTGSALSVSSSATYTPATGIAAISGLAMTTGTALTINTTSATLTTGRYISCNNAATEVFGIGANGHIHSTVSAAAPTIAVSQQNGITAAAITAGGSDTAGVITTTGTNNNGGATVLQITFGKTYTAAPKAVILQPVNLSGQIVFPYVSARAATTFDITIPASASSGATPSWSYLLIA